MPSLSIIQACNADRIPFPTIPGGIVNSLAAAIVTNYTTSVPGSYNSNHGDIEARNLSFCNVTISHTHPGKNDTLVTKIWLPLSPQWNGRMQASGGSGWVPGLWWITDSTMAAAVAEGYAALTTDGGAPSQDPATPGHWAHQPSGTANLIGLENLAAISLNDAAVLAKSVVKTFYGRAPDYSYWSGCSQGGRQGMMLAQRYPMAYDGIAAGAPAINWGQFFVASYFPQQVMNELNAFPHPCELDALTTAAINACDSLDGLVDGYISDPQSCVFDPRSMIGRTLACNSPGSPSTISTAAALVAEAAWMGARSSRGDLLWYTPGHGANLTAWYGTASTSCTADGVCRGDPQSLLTDWIKLFVLKDPQYNLNTMTRADYENVYRLSVQEYTQIIGTNVPDLSQFRVAGGKIITYHGLADWIIPYQNTRHYYDTVLNMDPNVHDFYRVFETPGLGHCWSADGAYPSGTFNALVKWVEEGQAPDNLEATNLRNETRLLCPYPSQPRYVQQGGAIASNSFVCT